MSIRIDYHEECESLVNRQITMELSAAHTYEAMAAYCARHDVAHDIFAEFFRKEAEEERSHARRFIDYQLKRGGEVKFGDATLLVEPKWKSIIELFEDYLKMEMDVTKEINNLTKVAESHQDQGLCVMLEDFITHQTNTVYAVSKHLTALKKVGEGMGTYMYEKHFRCRSKDAGLSD